MRTSWYHGWNVVAVCVLSQVAALGVATNCFSFFLEPWSREFGMPMSTLTLSITLFSVSCAVLAPIAGRICERYSVRHIFVIATLGVVLFHVLIGMASAGWQVIALYMVLMPVAITFSSGIPSQILVTRWFVRKRGLALAFSAFGLAFAGVVFPPIVIWLMKTVGWQKVWWIFGAAILLLVLPTIMLVIRNRPDERDGRDYVPYEIDVDAAPAQLSVRSIFSRPNFWMTMLVFVPLQFAYSAVNATFAPFVASRALADDDIALLVGIFSFAALCGKLSVGVLADRYGNRPPLVLVSVCICLGMAWLAFAQGFASLAGGFALVGFSQGVWVLMASCIATEFGSRGFGRAYGIGSAFAPIGALSPPLFARAQEISGSYTGGLLGMALLCVGSVLAACALKEPRRP